MEYNNGIEMRRMHVKYYLLVWLIGQKYVFL